MDKKYLEFFKKILKKDLDKEINKYGNPIIKNYKRDKNK
ncbi:hypothetical protein CMTB2_05472 [Caminibacter mediatlanticus TB-2]|uniref:Uncharacterized protein n=1 Tax=Caminibacter mediatlanticus TB-2 TaxID=391592 RepID=A0AAI9AG55_9BACT|nr:hypothetical protein CMTB2_05472 [Caminibacter mediatlanticus TB-2]